MATEQITFTLGTLDGVPVLRADGANAVPAELAVVDGRGTVVAVYTAGPVAQLAPNSGDHRPSFDVAGSDGLTMPVYDGHGFRPR